MGLDMYIETIRKKRVECPYCNEPFYAPTGDREERCYWRKNWDLFNFISNEIAPDGYGDEQYGADLELSIDDLEKIKSFIQNDKQQDNYQLVNI